MIRCVCHLLSVLVLLTVLHVNADKHKPKERHYYVAAVEIDWNYFGNDTHRFGPTYKKVVFREYEKGFSKAKTHPSWLGLLGPTLRAEEGETVVVTFRNMATAPYSIHPHGVAYGKQSEGAYYFDNTSQKEKEDDVVQPNSEHIYYWEVTSDVSPQPNDPACLTYTYISHQNFVEDYNSGLIGALLICKPGSLDDSGKQVGIHHDYVFLFGVFNEKESKNKPKSHDNHVKYTINGFSEGALPDVTLCAHVTVSLHLVGMSSEPEVFSVHINGQVLQHNGHKMSSVGLISGSSATASMVAIHTGRWLLSSHTIKHIEAGMHGFVDVKKCDGFEAPQRIITAKQRRQSREWIYYIAAEEIVWDYTPNMPEHIDEDFKIQYLRQSPTRIGGKYKKAVYTMYKNESFTERLENKQRKNELGILGPVIRAQIRDVIKIVFKNKASRPYSIYPHGLTIEKSEEGVNYPAGNNQSHGVQPGETHTYVWKVEEQDEPLDSDSRCLTRLYHSAVDTPRDIASGLIGPMLICKSQSLNVRNVQLKADKEQHAVLAVFDENKSWYFDNNIRQYTDRSKVNKADEGFYKSNVMHTINGYVFESGPLLGFCNGEVATWHVSSIGAQDYIQTATFYGHTFELNDRTEDFLSLYPMTGETISMKMDNIGIWLLASLNSHETTKGMRVKFQDVECYRDYQYEYSEYDESVKTTKFDVWNPPSLEEIKKEKPKTVEIMGGETAGERDFYTEMLATELGLRSLKNQSSSSDMEELDLSFLDYDAVDVLHGNTNANLNITNSKNEKNETFTYSNGLNEPSIPNWKEMDGQNNTTTNVLSQHISENTTNLQNSSASLTFDNFSAYGRENATADYYPNSLLNNYTRATNSTSSVVVLKLDVEVSDNSNPTVHNAVGLSVIRHDSEEITNLSVSLQQNSSFPLEMDRMTITLTGDNQTSLEVALSNDPPKGVREYVLSYPSLVLNESSITLHNTLEGNVTSMSHKTMQKDQNNTDMTHGNMSAAGINFEVDSSLERDNLTIFELDMENSNNKTNDSLGTTHKAVGLPWNSSLSVTAPTNSSLENITQIWHNAGSVTVNMSISNSSGEIGLVNRKNISALFAKLNDTWSQRNSSNETMVSSDTSLSSNGVKLSTSEESSSSEIVEEVLIYVQENNTNIIKTTSMKTSEQNWTYEGTHHMIPMEIPDYIMKYFEKESPQIIPPKKIRKVNLRQIPKKGQGMKTKRRMEYKPQPKSGLPFSPRGFNPGMTPRGSRPLGPQPVSNKEELINMPVIIGIPRPDFSDYELYLPGDEPDHLINLNEQNAKADEYEYVSYKDPYNSHEDIKNLNLQDTATHLKYSGPNIKTYFIAAEEVQWDYAGYGQRREEKTYQYSRETKFTKVVFRSYVDSSFNIPEIRGEINEHLGILGPVIKAEVGQSIMVVFKNNATRPYSLHPNGVYYTKQTEGLSYEDGSNYWYKYDNEVQPGTTFTYIWKVNSAVGPTPGESDCRTWVYYSGVNPERDINSGLIGPLLVCRKGTLDRELSNMTEFTLLFMAFDESQSWYYNKNHEIMQRKSRKRNMNPDIKENLKFHSINGIIYNLKGLRMYSNQLVCWHLINMGSPKDFQSVHFHGQTFLHKKTTSYRQATYPLLPGSFASLEMYPSKPGLWQLETEVGFSQQNGMQTLFLVLANDCSHPLGLESGSVKDGQITAINTRGYWEPHLARLNNQGKYNAWSTAETSSWIQVDFQRPVVISQVATQGAKQFFQSQFVFNYYISYSNDRRRWIYYKGDSKDLRKIFSGNQDAYETRRNTFFPPVIGRFIRLHPVEWYSKATMRLEFYGCELDGCSVPLGMESGLIENHMITASSTASSWYSGPWKPSLARLNKQGTINAWQAKYNDINQWLQVELSQIKKITGIVTQGAKSLGKEMYVISYTLQYSIDGIHWNWYTDDESLPAKTFFGNTNNSDHVKNYIFPPIFSRFIRIIPQSWMGSITLRVELLGCDFE